MAEFNGSWYLVFSENFEAYINAIGVSDENREKAMKMLLTTGENGLMEKYEVDVAGNSAKRYIYFNGQLFKESPAIPLNTEVDGAALDERPIKMKLTVEGPNRIVRHEKGADYEATVVSVIDGQDLTTTLTSSSGVQSVRKYKKL